MQSFELPRPIEGSNVMTVEQMRMELLNLYPGRAWKSRVLNMSDAQICAIYRKLAAKSR